MKCIDAWLESDLLAFRIVFFRMHLKAPQAIGASLFQMKIARQFDVSQEDANLENGTYVSKLSEQQALQLANEIARDATSVKLVAMAPVKYANLQTTVWEYKLVVCLGDRAVGLLLEFTPLSYSDELHRASRLAQLFQAARSGDAKLLAECLEAMGKGFDMNTTFMRNNLVTAIYNAAPSSEKPFYPEKPDYRACVRILMERGFDGARPLGSDSSMTTFDLIELWKVKGGLLYDLSLWGLWENKAAVFDETDEAYQSYAKAKRANQPSCLSIIEDSCSLM